ncbi:MAG: hypothetical protein KDJ35_00775 [Alphaproteobacteria bacterium]|nr:hypothetical protein [Alphaproteobacteria bacterium]
MPDLVNIFEDIKAADNAEPVVHVELSALIKNGGAFNTSLLASLIKIQQQGGEVLVYADDYTKKSFEKPFKKCLESFCGTGEIFKLISYSDRIKIEGFRKAYFNENARKLAMIVTSGNEVRPEVKQVYSQHIHDFAA